MTLLSSKIKAEIDDLAERISDEVNIKVPVQVIRDTVKEFYGNGIKEMNLRFGVNTKASPERLQALQSFVIGNIKFLNEQTKNTIRNELLQGLLNLEDLTSIRKRIQSVMETTLQRAELIARTETNRALNSGYLDSARQSGIKFMKEWVSAPDDGRRSAVCTHLDGKRVGIDEKFVYDGKEFDHPPAHPNCRSRVIFVQVSEKV